MPALHSASLTDHWREQLNRRYLGNSRIIRGRAFQVNERQNEEGQLKNQPRINANERGSEKAGSKRRSGDDFHDLVATHDFSVFAFLFRFAFIRVNPRLIQNRSGLFVKRKKFDIAITTADW